MDDRIYINGYTYTDYGSHIELNVNFSTEDRDAFGKARTFFNQGYILGSDLGIVPLGIVDDKRCKYCGKQYEGSETSCHACGGPR